MEEKSKAKNTCLLTLILFFFVFGNLNAQHLKKDLLSKTWVCNCNFNSDRFVLSTDNRSHAECRAKFSSSGKLILEHVKKKRVDSTYTYVIGKRSVMLQFDVKDSVRRLDYKVKKISGKDAYKLQLTFRANYRKRRGDDTVTMGEFALLQGEKRDMIENKEEIVVFSQKRALRNDSIDLAVWGRLAGYKSDTLLIDSDQYVEHNFYKKFTDTLHYIAPLLMDTIVRVKVPVKEITGIYAQREPFSSIVTGASLLAMGTGLVCVTSSILSGTGPLGTTLAQAGVISFLTIPVSLGLGMIFSKKKFKLTPSVKTKKIWKIERHMPGLVMQKTSRKEKVRIR